MCKTCQKLGRTCTMCRAEQQKARRPDHLGAVRQPDERRTP